MPYASASRMPDTRTRIQRRGRDLKPEPPLLETQDRHDAKRQKPLKGQPMYEREWDLDRSFFSEVPPDDARPLGLRVARAPTSGHVDYAILSERLIGCWTHFYLGRTQPCVEGGCHMCSPKAPRRWYGWLAGFDVARRDKVIVEVPPGVALQLKAYREHVGNLRGHVVRLSRRNKKENGPVVGQFTSGKFAAEFLPPAPDVIAVLMRMWRITKLEQLGNLDEGLKIHPDEILAQMRDRLA